MSNQAKRMAESLTEATTRRGFLGRLARVAGGAAGGIAGVLATGSALGAPEKKPCYYACNSGEPVLLVKYVPIHQDCPKKWRNCRLYIG